MDDYLSNLRDKLTSEGGELKTKEIITDITGNKVKLIDIVLGIGDVISSPIVDSREKGIDFLSWVMHEIPTDFLIAEEITAIATFYKERLMDTAKVAMAAVQGVYALVKMENVQDESIEQLLVPLFQDINCQAQKAQHRHYIFAIVRIVVENHLNIVKKLGLNFIVGIISIINGEIDPMNLLLIFRFLPVVLKNVELAHLNEEMFDVLSCYFPIDFNSSNKDLPVSREDLALGLVNCLSATDEFSDQCFTLIFEKLESTFKIAKIDSYALLVACCGSFQVESVSKHSNQLWKYVQKDVLPVLDSQISEAALLALSSVVKLLSKAEPPNFMLKDFLDDVLTSVRSSLTKLEDTLFQPAVNILLAVSSTEQAARYALRNLQLVMSPDTVRTLTERKTALSALDPFLSIITGNHRPEFDDDPTFSNLIQFYFDSAKLKDIEIQKLSLRGTLKLLSGFDKNARKQLREIVLEGLNRVEIRDECLAVLRGLAEISAEEVLESLKAVNENPIDIYLSILSAVADIGKITNHAVPQIMNVINSVNPYIGITHLLSVCRRSSSSFLQILHRDYSAVDWLVSWWTEAGAKSDETTLKNISEIVAKVVRALDTDTQKGLIGIWTEKLLQGDECNVILVEAILGSVRQDVAIGDLKPLTEKLLSIALESKNEVNRKSSARLLSAIANKSQESNFPKHLCESIFNVLETAESITCRLNSCSLLNWVIKGLIMANSPFLEPYLSKWIELLNREDVGETIAVGFHIIMEEDPLFLNSDSHCNVKLFYRQHLFTNFPKLMNMFLSSSSSTKSNYLLALPRLISGVPKQVALTEMANIAMIVVVSLESDKPNVITPCLDILSEFIDEKDVLLINHLQSLIPKLLKLSKYPNNMRIRMQSLKCLYRCAFYPTIDLIPYRDQVIRDLEACLDDKKRLVRTEAVKARSRWFLVGAPGEDAIFPR